MIAISSFYRPFYIADFHTLDNLSKQVWESFSFKPSKLRCFNFKQAGLSRRRSNRSEALAFLDACD